MGQDNTDPNRTAQNGTENKRASGTDLGILREGGGGGVLGRNSSRGGFKVRPREFSYTDKQKKTTSGG